MVFPMWIIMMSNRNAVAMSFQALKGGQEWRRKEESNFSMTTITSEEELAINIDDKKETSEQVKHFFSLDRNHRSKQKNLHAKFTWVSDEKAVRLSESWSLKSIDAKFTIYTSLIIFFITPFLSVYMFKQKLIKKNRSSVIERSIEYDCRPFGNRTFNYVRLTKFYCEFIMFDYRTQSNDWCSIGFDYRTFD